MTSKIIKGLGVVAALGVAALPLASYAADNSGVVNINVDVQDAIALTLAGGDVNQSVIPGALVTATTKTTATVNTNANNGFTLTVLGSDLTREGGSETIEASDEDEELEATGWNISVDSSWKGVKAAATIINADAGTRTDSKEVSYGFFVANDANHPAGMYKGTATYTATAK